MAGEDQKTEISPVAAPASPGHAVPAVQSGQVTAVDPGPPKDGEIVTKRRSAFRRFVLPLVVLAVVGYGLKFGYDWYVEGRFLVGTDDAYVRADMSIIAAKVSGLVAAVTVTDNQHVQAGDELVRIDDVDYKLAVAAAKDKLATQDATVARFDQQIAAQQPMIDQAEAQIAADKADILRTQADFERADNLARSDYGSKQRLDQARADRDRATAALSSAQAALEGAKANLAVVQSQKLEAVHVRAELQTALAQAESNLQATVIRAPFSGVIGNRAAQAGQYIQPGTRLLALVPLDKAYVEANFKETQLARLKPGQKVRVAVDAWSSDAVEGTVESLAPASGSQFSLLPPENATGNFTKIVQRVPVRIAVPASATEQGNLRPGLSVVVDVDTRDPKQRRAPGLLSALGLTR